MKTTTLLTLGASFALAASASAALTNGDFETGDLTGWTAFSFGGTTTNFVIDSSTQIGGDHSLASGTGDGSLGSADATFQNIGSAYANFTYSMDFRIDGTSTVREMDWGLSSNTGGDSNGTIRFGVDNTNGIRGIGINGAGGGSWGALNGGTFNPVTGTDYTWTIIGSSFDGTSSASYDMQISDSGGVVFTSTNNTFTTNTGASIASVNFTRGGNWGSGAYTVDNVSAVPEPSSAALLGLGGLALILRRRK